MKYEIDAGKILVNIYSQNVKQRYWYTYDWSEDDIVESTNKSKLNRKIWKGSINKGDNETIKELKAKKEKVRK